MTRAVGACASFQRMRAASRGRINIELLGRGNVPAAAPRRASSWFLRPSARHLRSNVLIVPAKSLSAHMFFSSVGTEGMRSASLESVFHHFMCLVIIKKKKP